jgi:hypothetical protein
MFLFNIFSNRYQSPRVTLRSRRIIGSYIEHVKLFLEKKFLVDKSIKNFYNQTAYDIAVLTSGDERLLELLKVMDKNVENGGNYVDGERKNLSSPQIAVSPSFSILSKSWNVEDSETEEGDDKCDFHVVQDISWEEFKIKYWELGIPVKIKGFSTKNMTTNNWKKKTELLHQRWKKKEFLKYMGKSFVSTGLIPYASATSTTLKAKQSTITNFIKAHFLNFNRSNNGTFAVDYVFDADILLKKKKLLKHSEHLRPYVNDKKIKMGGIQLAMGGKFSAAPVHYHQHAMSHLLGKYRVNYTQVYIYNALWLTYYIHSR